MMYKLFQGDCLERLKSQEHVKCIFADPPDNIGLGYDSYNDKLPDSEYEDLLFKWTEAFVEKADIVWLSFNARWTAAMGAIVHDLISQKGRPDYLEFKPCVQVFTFGQHNKNDLGNNHRPLWRLKRKSAKLYPDAIKVPSWRQRNGDKRAAPGGRVPGDVLDMQYFNEAKFDAETQLIAEANTKSMGVMFATGVNVDRAAMKKSIMAGTHSGDVFDFPRVTGNSAQRCDWHPTQLHEELVKRCVLLSTSPTDRTIDPFGGTGTTLRVCKALERPCTLIELDKEYCRKIVEANGLKTLRTPGGWGL